MAPPKSASVNNEFPSCKGGHIRVSPHGYILEYLPGHPASDKAGYVRQHRLVVELSLGRQLAGVEIVHHKNGCKTDNRIENLEVTNRTEHHQKHKDDPNYSGRKRLEENQVKQALHGRTTKEAADALGVNHQTLRNRFPELLTKRKPPSRVDDPEVQRLVRKAAADSFESVKEFATRTGISAAFAMKVCQHLGIPWVRKSRKGEVHRMKSTP